mgnify:CR=1 FL=1
MKNFYKEQYEEIKTKCKDLSDEKEKTMQIFTTLIIVAIIPLLNMITEMKVFGYKLATYIVFAVLIVATGVTLFFTVYIYLKTKKEIEIGDIEETKEQVDEIKRNFKDIIQPGFTEKQIEFVENARDEFLDEHFQRYYIDLYKRQYKIYNNRYNLLNKYYISIVANIFLEIVVAILIMISKIFIL